MRAWDSLAKSTGLPMKTFIVLSILISKTSSISLDSSAVIGLDSFWAGAGVAGTELGVEVADSSCPPVEEIPSFCCATSDSGSTVPSSSLFITSPVCLFIPTNLPFSLTKYCLLCSSYTSIGLLSILTSISSLRLSKFGESNNGL